MNIKNSKKLLEIFLAFFKIGCFTLGGGYAMIPLIEQEVVRNKKWVKESEVVDVFAVSQSIPGAIAINSSTFIGYKIAGRKGSIAATLGVILPSFLIITTIAAFLKKFQDNEMVNAAFLGIRSCVVALILLAAVKIGKTAIKDKMTFIIATITVIFVVFFDVHAIFAIIGGAAIGSVIYFRFPNRAKQIIEKDGEN